MFRPALRLIAILTFLLVPYFSHAQQAEAPVYKDGDWWRVKVDMVRPAGVSVSGPVLERFPEYIVKFESNKPKVFGVQGNDNVAVDLPQVIPLVLGRPGWLGDMLKFPMRIGLNWSDRIKFQPTGTQLRSEEVQYEVQAFEKGQDTKRRVQRLQTGYDYERTAKCSSKARESHRSSDSHLLLCSRCQSLLLHLTRPEALV